MFDKSTLHDLTEDRLNNLPDPKLKREFIKNLALLSQWLHRSGINHIDHYLSQEHGNKGELLEEMPLPFQRARIRKPVSNYWKIKDIGGLYHSAIGIGLSERDCYRFLMNYFGCSLRELFSDHSNFIRKSRKRAYKIYMRPILSQISNTKDPRGTEKNLNYIKGKKRGIQWICKRAYYHGQIKDLIDDPDRFINQGEIVKNEPGHTIVNINIEGKEVFIKRYNVKNFWHRLRKAFRSSRANNSWIACHWLNAVGIKTLEPIGIIEKYKYGIKSEAYFLSTRLKGEVLEKITQAPDPLIANKIAFLFRKMAWINFSHGDVKTGNFLLDNGHLKLLDLDAAKPYRWNFVFRRKIIKDYQRMLKNWDHLPEMQEMLRKRLSSLKGKL